MTTDWTIISKPWYGYDYLIEQRHQQGGEALPWLLEQVQASAEREFVAAVPQHVEILLGQDELISQAIAIDLAEFADVHATAGGDVTMVCSYADRLGLTAVSYRLPAAAELADFALSAFRQLNVAAREAIEFQFLARGVLAAPVHRRELIDFTAAQA